MIKVLKYKIEYKEKWDDFLINSKKTSFIFNRGFIEYHSDKYKDYSIIVLKNEEIVALLPANINQDHQLFSHQGLSFGGLIVSAKTKARDSLIYLKEILCYLSNEGIEILIYKEVPDFYSVLGSDEIKYAIFIIGAKLIRRDIALAIYMDSKIDMQKRRLRSIKKAQKLNINMIMAEKCDEFWNEILIPNLLSRFGVKPVHSVEEINLLKCRYPNNIKQYNVFLDGKIVAGTTIFETDIVAHAQYISGSEIGKKSGALDFLFFELINKVYKNKLYLDFGICNENNGNSLNHGLLEWKEGFGAKPFSHNFYEIKTNQFYKLEKVI